MNPYTVLPDTILSGSKRKFHLEPGTNKVLTNADTGHVYLRVAETGQEPSNVPAPWAVNEQTLVHGMSLVFNSSYQASKIFDDKGNLYWRIA